MLEPYDAQRCPWLSSDECLPSFGIFEGPQRLLVKTAGTPLLMGLGLGSVTPDMRRVPASVDLVLRV